MFIGAGILEKLGVPSITSKRGREERKESKRRVKGTEEEEGCERKGEKTVGVDEARESNQCWKFTWLLNIFRPVRPPIGIIAFLE